MKSPQLMNIDNSKNFTTSNAQTEFRLLKTDLNFSEPLPPFQTELTLLRVDGVSKMVEEVET